MVTHLNIPLDDEAAEKVRVVKESLGLTWAEFLERAADELDASNDTERTNAGQADSEEDDGTGPGGSTGLGIEEHASATDRSEWEIDDVVNTLDLPGSSETVMQRRIAVQTLYQYLREQGTARRREFLSLINPEDVGYSSAQSFWNNCIKDREALKSLPGVVAPNEGEHTWRYEDRS
jgi:hypothetical protein